VTSGVEPITSPGVIALHVAIARGGPRKIRQLQFIVADRDAHGIGIRHASAAGHRFSAASFGELLFSAEHDVDGNIPVVLMSPHAWSVALQRGVDACVTWITKIVELIALHGSIGQTSPIATNTECDLDISDARVVASKEVFNVDRPAGNYVSVRRRDAAAGWKVSVCCWPGER
jgi:hypothetical protein